MKLVLPLLLFQFLLCDIRNRKGTKLRNGIVLLIFLSLAQLVLNTIARNQNLMKTHSASSSPYPPAFRSSLAILVFFMVFGGLSILPSMHRLAVGEDTIVEIDVLSLREQELLRKERELLEAMGIATQVEAPDSDSYNSPELAKIAERSNRQRGLLDTIKAHPALKALPAKNLREDREVNIDSKLQPGHVRTHYSQDHHDGTTARRINRFFKLQPDNWNADDGRQRGTLSPLTEASESERRVPTYDSQSLMATIRSRRAILKMSPNNNTRILTLSRETPVEIDYRKGSWYRVKTSTGMRGWIDGSDLLFNEGVSSASLIHIGGISSDSIH